MAAGNDPGRGFPVRTTAGRPPSRFGYPRAPAERLDPAEILKDSSIPSGDRAMARPSSYCYLSSTLRSDVSRVSQHSSLHHELSRLDDKYFDRLRQAEARRAEREREREERCAARMRQLEREQYERRRALLLSTSARDGLSASGRVLLSTPEDYHDANTIQPFIDDLNNCENFHRRSPDIPSDVPLMTSTPTPAARSAIPDRAGTLPNRPGTIFLNGGEKPECKEAGLVLSQIPEILTSTSTPRSAYSFPRGGPRHTHAPCSTVKAEKASSRPAPALRMSSTSAPEASTRGHDRSQSFFVALTNKEGPNIITFKIADDVMIPLMDDFVNSEDNHRKPLDVTDFRSVPKASYAGASCAKGPTGTKEMDAGLLLSALITTPIIRQVAPWPSAAIPDTVAEHAAVIDSTAATEAAVVTKVNAVLIGEVKKDSEDVLKLTTIAPPLQDDPCTMAFARLIDPPNATPNDKAVASTLKNNSQVAPWIEAEIVATSTGPDDGGEAIHCIVLDELDGAAMQYQHHLPPWPNKQNRIASGNVDDDPRDRPPDRLGDWQGQNDSSTHNLLLRLRQLRLFGSHRKLNLIWMLFSRKENKMFIKRKWNLQQNQGPFWKHVAKHCDARCLGQTISVCFEKDIQGSLMDVRTQAGHLRSSHVKLYKLDWKPQMIRKRPALLMGSRMLPSATGASQLQ